MRSMFKAHEGRGFGNSPSVSRFLFGCVFLLGACCKMGVTENSEAVGLQGDLCFTTEGVSSLTNDLAAAGTTVQGMTSTLSRLGASDAELRRIAEDPFHSSDFRRVRFLFRCRPSDIVEYYSRRLPQHGWKLKRGLLLSEHSNAGGDWVAVYGKGRALVRVHVYGYRVGAEEAPATTNDEQLAAEREAVFDFISVTPAEFFGSMTYSATTSPPPGGGPLP